MLNHIQGVTITDYEVSSEGDSNDSGCGEIHDNEVLDHIEGEDEDQAESSQEVLSENEQNKENLDHIGPETSGNGFVWFKVSNYVLQQLDNQYLEEIENVVISPPVAGRCDKIKNELIKRLSASQEQRLTQLLEREETLYRIASTFLSRLRILGDRRSALKQYMPLKPVKKGIKIWERCDSKSGYIYDMKVYTGKEDDNADGTLGERMVRKLTSTIRNPDVTGTIAAEWKDTEDVFAMSLPPNYTKLKQFLECKNSSGLNGLIKQKRKDNVASASIYAFRRRYSGYNVIDNLGWKICILRHFVECQKPIFEFLLNAVGPEIARNNMGFRKAISVQQRLAVTLRFLASGGSLYL
ncbi:hypothetical protein ILUMI_00546 [Ignelater luminosus]|uniref:PiggyBac transposable element-derived protein domain-containing protein n=1 Tax=Ignelater luminosus TaxID=2038154 RepID=A0A8K0GN08_IGNLU|nr:hypothetical protein ILUMI_00546 [Ignelater luminosus]